MAAFVRVIPQFFLMELIILPILLHYNVIDNIISSSHIHEEGEMPHSGISRVGMPDRGLSRKLR